jgi:pSer/pThr/pTyr-binding forkhead associated (FHA) protein
MAGERASDSGEGSSVGLDAELGQAVRSEKALAYVVLFVGENPQRIYPIKTSSVLLGRADEAQVSISDASVSSHHARIVQNSQGFEIIDLDSTNGTFVAGKRTARAQLRNGDQVTVGNIEFMFLLDRPTSATVRLPDRIVRAAMKATTLVPTIVPTVSAESVRPRDRHVGAGDGDGEEDGPSLAEILRKAATAYHFVRERGLFIGAFALIGALLGIMSLFVVPPGVAAVAEVKLMPHMTLSANPNEDPWQNSERDSGLFVKGAERALGQGELIRTTLKKLNVRELTDARVGATAGRLKVEETGDHMFRVTYKDRASAEPSPLDFLGLHVRNYVDSEIARSLRELSVKVDFLRDQLKTVEGDVDRVSGQRAAYRQENADRLPEDSQQTHTSRFDLETRRTELSAQLHQLEGELVAAEDQLKTNRPEAQRKFQYSESYRVPLTEVNRKLSEAYARGLGEGHPEIQALKEEKQRLETLAKDELQSPTSALSRESDPNYQLARGTAEKLRAQVAATRANLADVQASLAQVQRVVRDLPRVEQHLSDLDHRQEATMQFHTDLFAKLKQAEVQLNLEKVSAESRFEVSPVHVERSRNRSTLATRGGLGLLLGIVAAALGIASREARRIIAKTLAAEAIFVPRRSRPFGRKF